MGTGASRVDVTRDSTQTPQIPTRSATYAAFAGIAEMGPIGTANVAGDPITSWAEWKGVYGEFTANAQHLPLAVKTYFDEGGQLCYTSRVVHCGSAGDPLTRTSAKATVTVNTPAASATKGKLLGSIVGPFVLDNGLTLNILIDALGVVPVTFAAAVAQRDSAVGPFALDDGDELQFKVNGGVTLAVLFDASAFNDIAVATASEVALVINTYLLGLSPVPRAVAEVVAGKVRLRTTGKGTGQSINIVGGTANAGKLAYTTGALAGTGDAADIAATTVAEVKTKIEALVAGCTVTNVGGAAQIESNTTGALSKVQVQSGSTAAAALGFDNALHVGGAAGAQATVRFDGLWDGTYAHAISVVVQDAISGDTARKDILFQRAGITIEVWRNVTLDSDDPAYLVTAVNAGSSSQKASRYLTVANLDATLAAPDNLPANGTYTLTSGNDGLASLADVDFYGSSSVNGATGLHAFNQVARLDLASIPGRCTATVHNQLVTWCEVTREGKTFAVLAIPSGLTPDAARTYITATADLKGLSEIAAIYGPWIYVDNPATAIFGTAATVLAPIEGAICGMMARVDASKEGGAFEHPAGALGTLRTARRLETSDYEDKAKRGLAFDDLLNPIRKQRGRPIYVDGARTLRQTGPFPFVGESRGAMLVTNEVVAAYDLLRHANIRERLYTTLTSAANVYLRRLTNAECFRTKIPDQAYFVDFGPGLNTPDVVDAAEVIGVIGLNTAKPAEFILLRLVPFRGLQSAFLAQAAQAA